MKSHSTHRRIDEELKICAPFVMAEESYVAMLYEYGRLFGEKYDRQLLQRKTFAAGLCSIARYHFSEIIKIIPEWPMPYAQLDRAERRKRIQMNSTYLWNFSAKEHAVLDATKFLQALTTSKVLGKEFCSAFDRRIHAEDTDVATYLSDMERMVASPIRFVLLSVDFSETTRRLGQEFAEWARYAARREGLVHQSHRGRKKDEPVVALKQLAMLRAIDRFAGHPTEAAHYLDDLGLHWRKPQNMNVAASIRKGAEGAAERVRRLFRA